MGLQVEQDKFAGGLAMVVVFAHVAPELCDKINIAFARADHSDETLAKFCEHESLPLVASQKFLAAWAHHIEHKTN